MGRKSVEADELNMDSFDAACIALEIPEEKCQILREAVEELCKGKRQKGKRELSEYQIFLSKCMREKKIKKFEEASSAMKECVGEWKEQKK
jgi:hypothetical protein